MNASVANLRRGHVNEALKDALKAVKLHECELSHGNHANALFAAQLYKGAERAFSAAQDYSPDESKYFYQMGLCRHNLNDFAGAIEYYNQGLITRNPVLAFQSGLARVELNDRAGARSDFATGLGLQRDPLAMLLFGIHCHLALGDRARAVQDFDELAAATDDQTIVAEMRYSLSVAVDDYAGAMVEARKLLAVDRNSSRWARIGGAASGLKDWSEAVHAYTMAIDAKDSSDPAGMLGNRAWVHLQMGNLQEAQKDCSDGLALNSHSLFLRSVQLELEVARGKLQTAVDHGLKLVASDPHYMRAHEWLAIAYDRLNQTQEATKHYEQFLLCKPRYGETEPDLHERRIKAKTRLSELHESRQNL